MKYHTATILLLITSKKLFPQKYKTSNKTLLKA